MHSEPFFNHLFLCVCIKFQVASITWIIILVISSTKYLAVVFYIYFLLLSIKVFIFNISLQIVDLSQSERFFSLINYLWMQKSTTVTFQTCRYTSSSNKNALGMLWILRFLTTSQSNIWAWRFNFYFIELKIKNIFICTINDIALPNRETFAMRLFFPLRK